VAAFAQAAAILGIQPELRELLDFFDVVRLNRGLSPAVGADLVFRLR